MLFAVDIDATIAMDVHGYAHYLNRELSLHIPESHIEKLTSYYEFRQLPEVTSFKNANEDRYQCAFNAASNDLEIMEQLVEVPGAVEGVHRLTQYGKVIYATCRKPEQLDITRKWLRTHGFPEPDQVYTCMWYHLKFARAYALADSGENIVIIDDHAEKLIYNVPFFHREDREAAMDMYTRLHVAAFGYDDVSNFSFRFRVPFTYGAFPSWQCVDELITPHIQKVM